MEIQKFNCQKCSRKYCVLSVRPLKGIVPLSLPCKHTMCDVCIKTKLKLNEQIKCDLCDQNVELTLEKSKELLEDEKFYEMFPINLFVLGQLMLELSQVSSKDESHNHANPYIDLKSIISKSGFFQSCSECKEQTCHKCVTCGQVYCDKCFSKIHSAFESLKTHTKEKIGFEKKTTSCQVHPSVDADFYCDTCKKPICMSCLVVGQKECAVHRIDNFHDKNIANLEKFKEAYKEAEEMFCRLTKTAVDIGNKLDVIYNSDESSADTDELKNAIRHHYAKLHAFLQRDEMEKLAVVKNMSETDIQSLERARTEVEKSIIAVNSIVNEIGYFIENINVKVNIADLVAEMKETINNTAWFLKKLEYSEDAPSFKFNADIFKLLEEHLTLNGETHRGYSLLPTKEVSELPPAPTKPVYPPETVVLDVRIKDKKSENASGNVLPPPPFPKQSSNNKPQSRNKKSSDYVPPPRGTNLFMIDSSYRSISNSMSSVNSNDSEIFQRNMKNMKLHRDEHISDLKEDTTEAVYVEHINDPSDFFVVRVCLQRKMSELKNELASAGYFQRPKHVIEGNHYLGLSNINNKFQRCKVLAKVNDNSRSELYHVFFIDHGPTALIPLNDLRMLPLNMTMMPALATHCQLANVRPIGQGWHTDDSKLMYRIINNKKMMLHVQGVLPMPPFGQSVQCNLVTIEDNVDVAKALVFHEQARFLQPEYRYEMPFKDDMPTLTYNPDLKKNQIEDVVITCIISPDKFFVRKHYLESEYEKLSESLQDLYGDIRKNHSGKVYCPQVGMLVAVHVNLDSEDTRRDRARWRRGVVLAPVSKQRIVLTLPDSGHEVTVTWNQLRKLHPRMFEIKALAIECHLSHISPVNKKWSEASVRALETYSERKLKAIVDDPAGKRRSMGVRLYDDSDPDNEVCINEAFIDKKYAVNIGALSFALPKPKPIQDKAPIPKNKVVKPKPEVVILKRDSSIKQKNGENLEVIVDRGPVKLEVKILSCQSPSQLYVSLHENQEKLMQLYKQLHTFYEENPPKTQKNWEVNDRCCVFDSKEKMWKRASILHTDGDSARVFHTDFAVVDEVPVDKIFHLLPEFINIPNGAIKCHLRGIMPAGGSVWPGITCELLNELLDQYTRFFITKKGSVKDKSMPVELWVYHVTPGDALEASKSEWRLINDDLVNRGLALPDRDTADQAVPEDTLTLLAAPDTVSGTVNQWLQLRPNSEEPVAPPAESASPIIEPKKRVKTTHKNWLPAEPIIVTEFECIPTFVDNDGIIFLHDVSSADILDLINISLNARYKNSEVEDTDWEVNDACIAVYTLDQTSQFCRGRVVKIFDSSNYAVEFVDYGNVEACSANSMRKELLMSDVPIQAVKCRLADITLVGGKRRLDAVEYLHKIIVEKKCKAKVLVREEDIYTIELYLKGQCLNKLLIETQFATSDSVCNDSGGIGGIADASIESDPDFIEESSSMSNVNQSLEKMDWSRMIEEETANVPSFKLVKIPIDSEKNFKCVVEYINDVNTMHLLLSDSNPENMNSLAQITAEIQAEGSSQPIISSLYPKKPCISQYEDDGIWYRAIALEHDQDSDKLKVLYVDFGNMSIVEKCKVRDVRPEWVSVPPRLLRVKLHRVKQGPGSSIADITPAYVRLLMSGELVARLVYCIDDMAVVELREEVGGPLVYQEMIDKGLIILQD